MAAPVRVMVGFLFIMVIVAFSMLLFVQSCLGESTDASNAAIPNEERSLLAWVRGDRSDEIGLLKDTLRNLGYPIENMSHDSLTKLDDATMVAILKLCRDFDLPHSIYGVRKDTLDVIMSGVIQPIVKPTATASARRFLYYGDQGDDVLALQQRLKEMSYPFVMNPYGQFDDELLSAVELFCQVNGIAYDREAVGGITEALQLTILSDKALPYPVEEEADVDPTQPPTPNLAERFTEYMTRSTPVGGYEIPNYVFWIACILLVVGCILLTVHFFMPSGRNREGTSSSAHHLEVPSRGRIVSLEVKYHGQTRRYNLPVERSLRLGRTSGDVALDPGDMRISRRHCELYFLQNTLMLRDYSSNGTIVNDVECKNCEYRLKSGDHVKIGDHEITVQF